MAINIKPENRGKFTAAAKRAGKGVQEYASQILSNKEDYSPTLVKRANFAKNASKWDKKAVGGILSPAAFAALRPSTALTLNGVQPANVMRPYTPAPTTFNANMAGVSPTAMTLGTGPSSLPSTTLPNQVANIDMSTTRGLLGNVGNWAGNTVSNIDWERAGTTAQGIVPYASNIINSFRRPPNVPVPNQLPAVTLRGVDYSADRENIRREGRTADLITERGLDGNTAAAVRSANLATRLGAMSDVNQRERNANTEISNRQNLINADINRTNLGIRDQFNRDVVGREIAIQNNQSANVANAADKYIASQNENAKRELDRQRSAVYESLFRNSGVMDRNYVRLAEALRNQGFSEREIDDMILMGQRPQGNRPDGLKMGGKLSTAKRLSSY